MPALFEGYKFALQGIPVDLGALIEGQAGDAIKTAGVTSVGVLVATEGVTGHVEVWLEGYINSKWVSIPETRQLIEGNGMFLFTFHHCEIFTQIRPWWNSTLKAAESDPQPVVTAEAMVV